MDNGAYIRKCLWRAHNVYHRHILWSKWQSGICHNELNNPFAVGVHTNGSTLIENNNSGVRLSQEKFTRIVTKWMRETGHIQQGFGLSIENKPLREEDIILLYQEINEGNLSNLTTLKTEATQGNKFAQFCLGIYYEKKKNNVDKAKEWYKKASKQGHELAEMKVNELNKVWREGEFEALIEKATKGDIDSQCKLGSIYMTGNNITRQNIQLAKIWLQMAAEKGVLSAQVLLAVIYQDEDLPKAIFWFQKAADQGHQASKEKLVELRKKIAIEQGLNSVSALPLDESTRSSSIGTSSSSLGVRNTKTTEQNLNDISSIYIKKLFEGVKADNEESLKQLEILAQSGHSDAQNALGLCYYYGYGAKQDYLAATRLLHASARQGNPKAQNNLETLNMFIMTFNSLQEKHDNQDDNIGIMAKLAHCYFHGIGVKKNYAKAVECLLIVHPIMRLCDTEAILGECYYHGYGIEKNIKKAREHWQNASDLGDIEEAGVNLAISYVNEEPRNYSCAERLLQNASARGCVRAQEALRSLHLRLLDLERTKI